MAKAEMKMAKGYGYRDEAGYRLMAKGSSPSPYVLSTLHELRFTLHGLSLLWGLYHAFMIFLFTIPAL